MLESCPHRSGLSISANVNGIAVAGGYAYLATANNTKRVNRGASLRYADREYSILPKPRRALCCDNGNNSLLGMASGAATALYAIDISAPESALPIINSIAIPAGISTILTYGTYLFGYDSTTEPLLVVDAATLATVNSLVLPGGVEITDLQ